MTAEAAKEAGPRGRTHGKRRRGREMALQMLYQSEMGQAELQQVLRSFDPLDVVQALREDGEEFSTLRPELLREALSYARRLVEGTLAHLQELDQLISAQADNWRLERMSAVDRNILRLAVYELLYEADVPKLVVLDEAIELAKRFGTEQSGRFVNGLLDGVLRTHQLPGSLH